MSAVEVHGLQATFPGPPPVHALRAVDLAVPAGAITAVLGPSGCGKTTLLRAVAGLVRPEAGTIDVGGRRVLGEGRPVPPERRSVGLVPQEGALFPHLDVAANVAFGLVGMRRRERAARVEEVLALVELAGMGSRRPHELSGGQQQRVALARALAPRPDVVLLDEPFSALDAALRATVREDIAAALLAAGTTGVLVTHDQDEALSLADHVAVMRDGRIVQAGPPAELYRRPADVWVARFVGDAVVVPGRRVGPDALDTPLGPVRLDPGVPTPAGAELDVLVRPEQIQPADADGGGVAARVGRVRFHGAHVVVDLALPAGGEVTARWPSTHTAAPGDVVAVGVVGVVTAFAPTTP